MNLNLLWLFIYIDLCGCNCTWSPQMALLGLMWFIHFPDVILKYSEIFYICNFLHLYPVSVPLSPHPYPHPPPCVLHLSIFTCHFFSHDVIFLSFTFQDTTWWNSPSYLFSLFVFACHVFQPVFAGMCEYLSDYCVFFLTVSTQKARTVWKQRKTSHVCSRLRLPHLLVRKPSITCVYEPQRCVTIRLLFQTKAILSREVISL